MLARHVVTWVYLSPKEAGPPCQLLSPLPSQGCCNLSVEDVDLGGIQGRISCFTPRKTRTPIHSPGNSGDQVSGAVPTSGAVPVSCEDMAAQAQTTSWRVSPPHSKTGSSGRWWACRSHSEEPGLQVPHHSCVGVPRGPVAPLTTREHRSFTGK